jgi:hypothetical protein
MQKSIKEVSQEIAKEIMAEMEDRSLLNGVDDDLHPEIQEALSDIIEAKIGMDLNVH